MLLIDGPLEWANMYRNPSLEKRGVKSLFEPIVHDAVAAIGRAQASWIESRNPQRQIQYMTYKNHRIKGLSDPGSANHSYEFDFILTVAKTPYFSEQEKRDLSLVLETCAEALERMQYKTLVRLFDADLKSRVEAKNPSAVFSTEGSFSDALTRGRCVIGTPSSVLLEAMASNRATAILMFRDAPLLYQAGWLLGQHPDWEGSLADMHAGVPERMEYQRQIVRENLSEDDFFEGCRDLMDSAPGLTPRSLDEADLAFENQMLRKLLGWRGRWMARLTRRFFAP